MQATHPSVMLSSYSAPSVLPLLWPSLHEHVNALVWIHQEQVGDPESENHTQTEITH